MLRFKDYITEIFDSVLPYTENIEKQVTGTAYTYIIPSKKDKVEFKIYYYTVKKYIALSLFSESSAFDISNKGNAFAIYSTIIHILKEFLKKHDVKKINFTAHDRNQISLYNKFSDILIKNNWKKQVSNNNEFNFTKE